jgi:predicted esterase
MLHKTLESNLDISAWCRPHSFAGTDAGFGQQYPLILNGKHIPGTDQCTALLSELEVLAVVHQVLNEAHIDRTQLFLAGHSMGGLGAGHLSAKYPDMWAGVAVMAAGTLRPDYPPGNLRKVPIALFQGTNDVLSESRGGPTCGRRLQSTGQELYYLEIADATHVTTYGKSTSCGL